MIEALEAALEDLAGTDPAALGDAEAVERLHACLTRLDAVLTRATAAFDASGAWRASGARSAAAWVAARGGGPAVAARRRVSLGRALRRLPVAEEAWLAGRIGAAHVSVLERARTPATEAALARDEALLVGQAEALGFRHFTNAVA